MLIQCANKEASRPRLCAQRDSLPTASSPFMRPMFTIHAGEFLVGQYIEKKFRDRNVWVPTKDIGVDLLVTNAANTGPVTLQVKYSRDFLPVMKLDSAVFRQLKSCTWFRIDRDSLNKSTARYWVFDANARS